MKAAVVTRYGPPDVVTVRDVPKPEPGPGEVLVRVHATTVNRTDAGELCGRPILLAPLFYGLRRPRRSIFGMDVAGDVEAIGAGVTLFKPGDRVFGFCPSRRNGAHAEYVCMSERSPLALIPAGLSYDEAVVCEGAFYASASVQKYAKPGSKVMIYGASGAIGSSAVQLAKCNGAHVTAVVPTRHVQLAERLGADRVIDYMTEDFTGIDEKFDFILDAVGKTSFFRCRKSLKADGVYASTDVGPYAQNLPLVLWSAISGSNRIVVPVPSRGSVEAFMTMLRARMEAGQFRATIDRAYPLAEIADAYRYVETGQKAGIVVISVISA